MIETRKDCYSDRIRGAVEQAVSAGMEATP
jgi:hypothetical protein